MPCKKAGRLRLSISKEYFFQSCLRLRLYINIRTSSLVFKYAFTIQDVHGGHTGLQEKRNALEELGHDSSTARHSKKEKQLKSYLAKDAFNNMTSSSGTLPWILPWISPQRPEFAMNLVLATSARILEFLQGARRNWRISWAAFPVPESHSGHIEATLKRTSRWWEDAKICV